MTEQNLINLGFKKVIVPPEEAGDPNGFHYYTYDKGSFSLISNSNDETNYDDWKVYIFNHDLYTSDYLHAFNLVNSIKNMKHEKQS